jgi:hypothetical protein
MDKNFGRILSLERYKRNHNLIEALFAPNSISKLEKPSLFADVSKEKLETLKQMQVFLFDLG